MILTNSALRGSLLAARDVTDRLFPLVKPEALYDRPIAERHRLIFYLGHLEAFDWNLLGRRPLHSEFDRLFAFGIDPVDGNNPQDQPEQWPSVSEVVKYRAAVRKNIDDCLEREGDSQLISAAIEHRLMHAETLTYLLHALPLHRKHEQTQSVSPTDLRSIENPVIEITAGAATLGARRREDRFAWDNEFGLHHVDVPSFAIDKYKVSNAQYLAFLDAGGYEQPLLWNQQGWEWIRTNGIQHPRFWIRAGNRWALRTMFSDIPFQPNWPVYVSHAEAQAYSRWRGKTLPTEAQFHRAAFGEPGRGEKREYPWGNDLPQANHGNFDGRSWNPVAVDAYPDGDSAFGVSGLVGNGWEWTSTPFGPFPGFEPFEFYKGYSADFFDGRHYVLKGGSARTASVFLRRSFRNWFQPCYPNLYAGFRCVEN